MGIAHTRGAKYRPLLSGVLLLALAALCAGCHSSNSGGQHYHLHGKVVSVNQREGYVEVDHDAIPGYMAAMTMPYTVQDPKVLTTLSPGDEITANLVLVQGVPELENIVVVKKAKVLKPRS
ncbi:MAG TPA: copper-binding protein [Candidatus Acidoferrales bacterium]|nr:copper-binding protein [Candidatus Acidoferrales bacterium]